MADDPKPGAQVPPAAPVEKPAETPAAKPAEAPAPKADETPAQKPERKAGEPEAPPKAPEKYALKVPDAGAAFIDDADLKDLETVARAANWSNEDAQAALDEHIARVQARSDRYLAATKADPEYGGEHLTESQRLAKRVIDRVRPTDHKRRESFMAFLNRDGAGNHIEVLSFLADLGKMMGEDSPAHGRSISGGSGKDAAATLYDHPTSQALEKAGAGA